MMLETWELRLRNQKEYLDNLQQQVDANQKIVSDQRQALMVEFDGWEREYNEYQEAISKLSMPKPVIQNPAKLVKEANPLPPKVEPVEIVEEPKAEHYETITEPLPPPKIPDVVPPLGKKPSWAKVEGSIFEHLK